MTSTSTTNPQTRPHKPTTTTSINSLPPELLDHIFSFLDPIVYDSYSPFRASTERLTEQTLVALSQSQKLLPFVRRLLFHTVHIGSSSRAKDLVEALKIDFSLQAYTDAEGKQHAAEIVKSYLVPFVQGLRIEIKDPGIGGIKSKEVEQLVKLVRSVEQLDVLCGDKAAWLDNEMLVALRGFNKVQDLEIDNCGYPQAFDIFGQLDLKSLKLKKIVPHRARLQTIHTPAAVLASAQLGASPALQFGPNLTQLVLWDVTLTTDSLSFLLNPLTTGLSPSTLRNLTLHHLATPQMPGWFPPLNPHQASLPLPFPSSFLLPLLTPYIPTLTTFHLVNKGPSFPINSHRNTLKEHNLLSLTDGTLLYPPDPHQPIANALSPLFTSSLHSLTLGGPICFTGKEFFESLSSGVSLKELRFMNCADLGEREFKDGLELEWLKSEGLSMEWSNGLRVLDVKDGMSEINARGEEAWSWDLVGNEKEEGSLMSVLRRKVGAGGKGGGAGGEGVELRHGTKGPMLSGGWENRKASRKGSGKRGRGKTADDGGGASKKTKKV